MTFDWQCPDCSYFGSFHGETSRDVMRELHIGKHRREKWQEEQTRLSAIVPYVPLSDRLNLTESDRELLRSMGIKVTE